MADDEELVLTFYPGVGADEAIAELHGLVGQITATWAEIEDQLFTLFVIAISGTWHVGHLGPYRAVFFTFSSFEGKMRMVHNAMKARYGDHKETSSEWDTLRRALNDFAKLRNEIAHLVPNALGNTDPNAKAHVRLLPPVWKSGPANYVDNPPENFGYSVNELWQALAPYWGYHPRIHGLSAPSGEASHALGYRLQQFALKLLPPLPSPPAAPSPT